MNTNAPPVEGNSQENSTTNDAHNEHITSPTPLQRRRLGSPPSSCTPPNNSHFKTPQKNSHTNFSDHIPWNAA